MNGDKARGQWKQLRGELKTRRGKRTAGDVAAASGSADDLAGKLQERYGIARDEARQQVRDFEGGL